MTNYGELVIKVNETSKCEVTVPESGDVKNVMIQKGEVQKFQTGTKILF
jgi:hypothetical protein